MLQKIKKLTKEIGVLSIGFTLALLITIGLSVSNAWTEPPAAAPAGNLGAPINTSSTGQIKAGGLSLNSIGAVNGLIVQKGNVGIGVLSPAWRLEVAGDIKSGGANTWGFTTPDDGRTSLYFGQGANNSIATYPIEFKADGGARFNGNVGIGTTAPSQKLDVVGYVKGQTGLCIGNDCRTSWPSASGTIEFTGCHTVSALNDSWATCSSGEVATGVSANGNACGGECVSTFVSCCKISVD